jgi:hypothetical protein
MKKYMSEPLQILLINAINSLVEVENHPMMRDVPRMGLNLFKGEDFELRWSKP